MERSHERDESIERLLRQTLKTSQPVSVTDACLDAEMLAALIDGDLSEPALKAAQSHIVDCARCEALMAALARIEPRESREPVESKRLPFGWLTWAVPLTAAAAVMALWVAVSHRNETMPSAPTAPAAATIQTPSGVSAERQESEKSREAENRVDELRRGVRPDAQVKKEVASKADEFQRREAAAPSARAETIGVRSAAGSVGGLRSNAQAADVAELQIQSPDPMIRWRIRGTVVEHSIDGGARWDIQQTGLQAELTAGSAVSGSVVWIVGRSGMVLLSTDAGNTWRRIQFPEMTDLSSARARDAKSVGVTTADGRVFSTTDAGATWVPRPLQDF